MSYINKAEHLKISNSIKKIGRSCIYDCYRSHWDYSFPVCEKNKCVKASDLSEIYSNYQCDKILPALKIELENFKFCEKDSDCVYKGCILGCQDVVSQRFTDKDMERFSYHDTQCPHCGIKKCNVPKKIGCVKNQCQVLE